MVYMMQKYIFSKVKSSHNAQNAQKWPSKYPKRPKTVQNPTWLILILMSVIVINWL